ncbi:MAG: anaerobic ribonucleoside-triphosphate reductase activating protein [Atopobiaceae bacterium]|jgi:anaerobic ribonucleoside-triphosphate reductase activating protein
MNYAEIKYCDIANGPGVRTSLFVSGCRLRCPGCFNSSAWDFAAGNPFDHATEDKILESLQPFYIDGLTILGGEPTEPENAQVLAPFLQKVRQEFGSQKNIWLYSGRTLADLLPGADHGTPAMHEILSAIDVLVDGPWIADQYDISLRFRGSANQRLIDIPKTLAAHQAGELMGNDAILWRDEAVYTSKTMDV